MLVNTKEMLTTAQKLGEKEQKKKHKEKVIFH